MFEWTITGANHTTSLKVFFVAGGMIRMCEKEQLGKPGRGESAFIGSDLWDPLFDLHAPREPNMVFRALRAEYPEYCEVKQ